MKQEIIILLAQLTAFIALAIWLYNGFILPATRSKQPWYADYLQLCDFIKEVSNYNQLNEALEAYYRFTANKTYNTQPAHQACTRHIVRLLKKKFRIYRNKTVIA